MKLKWTNWERLMDRNGELTALGEAAAEDRHFGTWDEETVPDPPPCEKEER